VQGDDEKDAFYFEVQSYNGETVLTWWEGHHTGFGQGEYVLMDHSYREITRIRAGNGYEGDHHARGHGADNHLQRGADGPLLRRGPTDGTVLDGIAQEVDIETGEVLFEWHSSEHVALKESYWKPNEDQEEPFDYFHINLGTAPLS